MRRLASISPGYKYFLNSGSRLGRLQVFREFRDFGLEGLERPERFDVIDRDEAAVVVLARWLDAEPEAGQKA